MTISQKTLQRLRDKEQKKYELGLAFQAKARKYLEEAKKLSFKRLRVQEELTAQLVLNTTNNTRRRHMESFALKTPETIKEELDQASDDMAEKQYNYKRLDEHKKIISEMLTLNYKLEKNCSMAEAKSYALSDDKYKTHIDGLLEAEKIYTKAKSNYANLLATLEYMRSWIATQRHISKQTIEDNQIWNEEQKN